MSISREEPPETFEPSNLSTGPDASIEANDVIVCPICGGVNPPNAIFCGNPACHKALGEFRYVLEEIPAAGWHEKLANRVTAFMGRPHFLAGHFSLFIIWVLLNTGLVAMFRAFDTYPFGFLGIILTAEAIFITGCVLISQNRQSEYALRRAELDYEVNVRSYREIHEVRTQLESVSARLERIETSRGEQQK